MPTSRQERFTEERDWWVARRQLMEDVLPYRSRRLITMRYGLDGDDPVTLREAGARYDITAERVRQQINEDKRTVRHSETTAS